MSFRSLSRHNKIKIRLAKELSGKLEVVCKVGKIDVLTKNEAIEIKHIKDWKQGLGQALCYAETTNTKPRIHLYGKERLSQDKEEIISKLGLRISYELSDGIY